MSTEILQLLKSFNYFLSNKICAVVVPARVAPVRVFRARVFPARVTPA